MRPRNGSRRRLRWVALLVLAALNCLVPLIVWTHSGWTSVAGFGSGRPETVWGEQGMRPGQLQKPRAMAIDARGELYIVDKSARIQVFDQDGGFLRGWRTPEWANGKPTGLSFDQAGRLLVADTHYFRILFYERDGTLLADKTLGGTFGHEPGTFGLVTDAVTDSQGCLYVSEYGDHDRIQKFSPQGEYLMEWGSHGSEPGQFARPQSMAVDENDLLWVVDACNDRVQVFDARGTTVRQLKCWGRRGAEPGQMRYPYDLVLSPDGYVYIVEFGNHRVQKFTRDGQSVATWGSQGRGPGQLFNPWALVQDERGRIHVLDTYNHRVQRLRL
jgi:DNA-binding beta-propeller fold protein YncE